jgi:hypothetical protein
MLNREKWDAYLASGGKGLAALFEKSLTGLCEKRYAKKILALYKRFCPSEALQELIYEQLIDFIDDAGYEETFEEVDELCVAADPKTDFMEMLSLFIYGEDGEPASDREFFKEFEDALAYTTTYLASRAPERFIPYYFYCTFNILTSIAAHFEISLPPLPEETDFRGRIRYYEALSAALLKFGRENGMTPYELHAFLYDYAPKTCSARKKNFKWQAAKSQTIYLMSMERYDDFFSDKSDAVIPWHCAPETHPATVYFSI